VRHFNPIDDEAMKEALIRVSVAEGLSVGGVHLNAIIKRHAGDLRNAIGCLQAYSTFKTEIERERFILSLGDTDLNAKTFLRMCVKVQGLSEAVAMIDSMPLRTVIKQVLDYAVSSSASPEAKMKVIEASIVSERDVLMGVDETVVRWNYCRILCE
jgi:DNA polymerase III delta prime subunit